MGSDFSALDAELDALGAGVSHEALARAASHGLGDHPLDRAPLSSIDDALMELGHSVLPVDLHVIAGGLPIDGLAPQSASRAPASEEIVLPEPVLRDFRDGLSEQSGELPLEAHRSGSFPLPDPAVAADEHAQAESQVLLDAELDELLEMTAESAPLGDGPKTHVTDLPPALRDSIPEGAFEALFNEATRRSSIPSARFSQAPAPVEDDTDTFDSAALAFAEAAAAAEPGDEELNVEELDSAEFQVVASASSLPPRASEPPEKRPSFLGRLFGRKED